MDKKRKKWLRNIGVIMLVLYEVLPGNLLWRTEVEMTAADDFYLCYPVEEKMTDGRTLSLYLPVQPAKRQPAAVAPYERLTAYKAIEGGGEIQIVHGVLTTEQTKVRFDLAGFGQVFPQVAGTLAVQGEGTRLVGGTPLHILEGVDKNERKECLGYQAGRDVWLFYFQCAEDDDMAKAMLERAIESIAIN